MGITLRHDYRWHATTKKTIEKFLHKNPVFICIKHHILLMCADTYSQNKLNDECII